MSSPPNSMLTSYLSRPSGLRDGRDPNNNGIGFGHDGLLANITHQDGEVSAQEVGIEERRSAKQICDADRVRFRQFYDDELRRKKPAQFLYRERPPGGPKKPFQAGEGVESNKATQERLRARQEQRVRDDQLREGRRLARQRAW